MATLKDYEHALVEADKAGDENAARALAQKVQDLRSQGLADVGRSALSGAARGIENQAGFINAAVLQRMMPFLQARTLLNTANPYGALGADYEPATKAGEYAKNIAAGAMQMPGPGYTAGTVMGGLGGAASQGAKDAGLGPAGQLAAALAPFLGYAGFKAVRPGVGYSDLRTVASETEPSELLAMRMTQEMGQKRGVDLMPWQAAPEGSALHEAGSSIARRMGAMEVQKNLRDQTGKGTQVWIQSKVDPLYDAVKQEPVPANLAEALRNAVQNVKDTRVLHPASADAKVVDRISNMFGQMKPGDKEAFINELHGQLQQAAPGATKAAALAKLMAAAEGKVNPPPVFKPGVSKAGEVLSAKQQLDAPSGPFISSTGGTKGAVRGAIDETMEAVPGYTAANKEYERVKQLAEIVARDQKLKGQHVLPAPERQARTTGEVTVPYALFVNPGWASIPLFREWAGKRVMRDLDAAFAAKDFGEFQRIMNQNPQLQSFISLVRAAGTEKNLSTVSED